MKVYVVMLVSSAGRHEELDTIWDSREKADARCRELSGYEEKAVVYEETVK